MDNSQEKLLIRRSRKNNRLNDITELIDSIKTQKTYNQELEEKAKKYIKKYPDILKDYKLITTKNNLKECKYAGYIRYINKDDELRYGGILLKIYTPPDSDITFILLQNKDNYKWNITWERNIIFYKPQVKKGDNLRNLFISLLDEN